MKARREEVDRRKQCLYRQSNNAPSASLIAFQKRNHEMFLQAFVMLERRRQHAAETAAQPETP